VTTTLALTLAVGASIGVLIASLACAAGRADDDALRAYHARHAEDTSE